jgi:biofilm protein TabA
MIISNINFSNRYSTLHPLFNKAFTFINTVNRHQLLLGKNEIENENLFAIFTEPGTTTNKNVKLESHCKYIDIHYIIEGAELFGYTSISNCHSPIGEFNTEDDYVLYNDVDFSTVLLAKGDFVIVFPEDPHAPGIETKNLKKIVLKVKL